MASLEKVTDAVAGGLVQAEKMDAYHVIKAAELKAREAAALKRLDGRWAGGYTRPLLSSNLSRFFVTESTQPPNVSHRTCLR